MGIKHYSDAVNLGGIQMSKEATILIAGSPRSGTSWLHFLLASHPDIVTCRETHVYDKYVGPLKSWYDKEIEFESNDGLSSLFSEEEFVREVLAPIVERTFDKISAGSEKNKVRLEKTPGNILWHQLISRIQPEARIIFVCRDPRAVYASFKAASEHAWGSWTKKSVEDFCRSWNKYTSAYLAAKNNRNDDSIICVHFEKLKNNSKKYLTEILEWAKLDTADGVISEALKNNSITNLRKSKPGTIQYDRRRDFYRKGKAYGWVEDLSLCEIRKIETHCMDLMTIMGYEQYAPRR